MQQDITIDNQLKKQMAEYQPDCRYHHSDGIQMDHHRNTVTQDRLQVEM